MKTFSKILSEVAQPKSEDELNFKEKHIIDPIDYTVAPESTFSGSVDKDDIDGMKRYRKNKRLADYQRPDDEAVYEGVTLKRDIPGQEDNDVDNDGDTDMTDAQLKYRRHAQVKKYKIDEAAFVIPEEILATEKNAFHTAAANAHAAGKKHFAFGGKKYPVTMSPAAAKTFAGKGGMNESSIDNKVHDNTSLQQHFGAQVAGDAANHRPAMMVRKAKDGKTYHLINTKKGYVSKLSEAMDPVGQEDDDINNDGKVNKSDKYLHARRKAISASIRAKIKEGFGAVTAAGGDYDEEESHQRYKKSNATKKENVTLGGDKGLKIYGGKTRESDIAESEELDEISKDTVRAYKYKAMMSEPENDREYKNRSKGIERATDRLTKEDIDEAVEVRHDRYMRSHGKKARDSGQGSGSWMFTHKEYGTPDYNDKKEVHTARGNFADAKKSAQKWAKENGHHSVYVMEAVELDEISKKTLGSYVRRASVDAYRRGQDVEMHSTSRGRANSYGAARRHGELEDKGRRKANNRIVGIDRATQRLTKEEVEQIDELKKSTLASYVKKASTDQFLKGQAVQYHTNKAQNADGAFAKQSKEKHYDAADKALKKASNRDTGIQRAADRLARESVELDEVSKKTLGSYRTKARLSDKDRTVGINRSSAKMYPDQYKNSPLKAKVPANEEVELGEAFNAGSLKLNDGSTVSVKPQDAKLLNQLINGLRPDNAKKMMKVAMTDKDGFNEILGFAREAL